MPLELSDTQSKISWISELGENRENIDNRGKTEISENKPYIDKREKNKQPQKLARY